MAFLIFAGPREDPTAFLPLDRFFALHSCNKSQPRSDTPTAAHEQKSPPRLQPSAGHEDRYQDFKTYDFQPIGFVASCLAAGGQPQTELFFKPFGGGDCEVPALAALSGTKVAGDTLLSVVLGRRDRNACLADQSRTRQRGG